MHCLDGTVDTFAKVPEVELGLKSVLFIELIARGGNKDIHSLNFPLSTKSALGACSCFSNNHDS